MPTFKVEDDSGNTLVLEGDSSPTEQELEEIFSSRAKSQARELPTPEAIQQGLAGVAHASNLSDTATRMTSVGLQAPTIPERGDFGRGNEFGIPRSGEERAFKTIQELGGLGAQHIPGGIDLPSFAPSREQMKQFLTLSNPFEGPVTPETDPTGLVPPPEWLTSAATGAVQGVDVLGRGLVNFATTPEGATQLALMATPLAPLVSSKFAYDMSKGAAEAAKIAGTKFGEGDIQGGTAAATEAGMHRARGRHR